MKVEILKHPTEDDWMLAKKCTLVTVGKDSEKPATPEWKKKLLGAGHSPIRVLEFCFRITDVPYWVSVHLTRHVHAVPFVKTQRNDRQNAYDRGEAPQNSPVDMCWFMNAEELITIAHKRLCHQASKETRELIEEICRQVIEINPEFEGLLVPLCQYRNGVCTEFYPCGLYKKFQNNGGQNDEM